MNLIAFLGKKGTYKKAKTQKKNFFRRNKNFLLCFFQIKNLKNKTINLITVYTVYILQNILFFSFLIFLNRSFFKAFALTFIGQMANHTGKSHKIEKNLYFLCQKYKFLPKKY